MLVVVFINSGARQAVVTRQRARQAATVSAGRGDRVSDERIAELGADVAVGARSSKRRPKFQRAFDRSDVTAVSLLGPLLLPTQFTTSMPAA